MVPKEHSAGSQPTISHTLCRVRSYSFIYYACTISGTPIALSTTTTGPPLLYDLSPPLEILPPMA